MYLKIVEKEHLQFFNVIVCLQVASSSKCYILLQFLPMFFFLLCGIWLSLLFFFNLFPIKQCLLLFDAFLNCSSWRFSWAIMSHYKLPRKRFSRQHKPVFSPFSSLPLAATFYRSFWQFLSWTNQTNRAGSLLQEGRLCACTHLQASLHCDFSAAYLA